MCRRGAAPVTVELARMAAGEQASAEEGGHEDGAHGGGGKVLVAKRFKYDKRITQNPLALSREQREEVLAPKKRAPPPPPKPQRLANQAVYSALSMSAASAAAEGRPSPAAERAAQLRAAVLMGAFGRRSTHRAASMALAYTMTVRAATRLALPNPSVSGRPSAQFAESASFLPQDDGALLPSAALPSASLPVAAGVALPSSIVRSTFGATRVESEHATLRSGEGVDTLWQSNPLRAGAGGGRSA
ncbi:MAG: hypothetical protein EOO65_00065 [Methanosarcinales archaeon]|nr:MAG: hypothetical protein EOO65_00065 [Methanosarcinales archaeon]